MKIENDSDPYMWFTECLGPEPQDWMKDVGLDWFDEELLGRPESPSAQPVVGDHYHHIQHQQQYNHQHHDYPSYTIESSAWLIQQNLQRLSDSEDDSQPPPVLPPMIPGTRSFSDELHRIRKPYALGSHVTTGLTVCFYGQYLCMKKLVQ